MENNGKQFDLGAILSVTTGILYTNIEDFCEVLEYLTGDSIYTHQIPRVIEIAKAHILSEHPELTGVGENAGISNESEAIAFVDEQKKIYGDKLTITPFTKNDGYSTIDPIDEAVRIFNGKRM